MFTNVRKNVLPPSSGWKSGPTVGKIVQKGGREDLDRGPERTNGSRENCEMIFMY
jgi:hypothetical protein